MHAVHRHFEETQPAIWTRKASCFWHLAQSSSQIHARRRALHRSAKCVSIAARRETWSEGSVQVG
ncbi:hypothetical protein DL95DRAFT_397086, partial [Leptodontidium sp. 2 PMI_412]